MTAQDPVAALRHAVDELAVGLAAWTARAPGPDAEARRGASRAVGALDEILGEVYACRAQLTAEIRASDAATAARVDQLLAAKQP